jgi:hypothetical protein
MQPKGMHLESQPMQNKAMDGGRHFVYLATALDGHCSHPAPAGV